MNKCRQLTRESSKQVQVRKHRMEKLFEENKHFIYFTDILSCDGPYGPYRHSPPSPALRQCLRGGRTGKIIAELFTKCHVEPERINSMLIKYCRRQNHAPASLGPIA